MPVPARRRRVWPWILFGVLALLLATAVVAGALTMQFWSEAQRARAAVGRAASGIAELRGSLETADEAQLLAATDAIQANVTLAVRTVDGPLWDLASRVPFIGQNVDAVRRVTHAVDVLVERALTPGLQFLSVTDFDELALDGGGIDLEPFRQVQSSIPEIAAAFADAQAIVAPIDTATLLPEVSESISDILTFIDLATPALGVAEKYLPTLLDMAGSGGTRTYLLIFQNNAEIRATGGNPAASMIVTLTDGKLGYVDQASSQTFYDAGTQDDVYVALPAETTGLYLPTLAKHSQDYTFTPDFPTTAQLFQALWIHTTGATFDGVVSIDPVVLSYMLAVAGPVTLGTGDQLTADNAVSVLLRDAYERYPESRDSDRFFADAAKQVFVHLTTSAWDPLQMLEALKRGAAEQRVNLAFVDPAAQALAVELGVDGALAGDTTTQTQVGIYLNDSSVSKLEYHLTTSIIATCDAAARTITTTMTLANGIGDDIRSPYTLGLRNWQFGLPRTTMILDVLFFAPPGGQITHTVPAKGDVARWERSGVEKGNSAVSKTVFVGKGQTVTTSFTVALPSGDLGPLRLRYSPTATATPVTIDPSCAGLFPAAG
ncbi:DUF4012 domain-containing protein [Microbacterium sp. QXD-8]|uniref:DUF4012 domain-containing protein n=1 Tax=Microbacterium psychrotolerans TaxID=3068321 RepID=A0ABU0Z162_9MICO|nr:DUF4012 domain-containing protein [Microbacterium sp. QXD-8]MDQ7878318.1 DUF4012 domain-containing protein [Microbacterium sp. QXD-8]